MGNITKETKEILKNCWVMTTDHTLDEENIKLKEAITEVLNETMTSEETADEMFKKLGYEKIGETENEITYVNEYDVNIIFNLLGESFCKTSEDEKHYYTDDIDMQELKAINKKCEELGWI